MKQENPSQFLDRLIYEKELELKDAHGDFKYSLSFLFEELRPVNLIKNAFMKVFAATDIKKELLNTSILFITRLVTKNMFSDNRK